MNVYIWFGFPHSYYHMAICVTANSKEEAIQAAYTKAMAEDCPLIEYNELDEDAHWRKEFVEWLHTNIIEIDTTKQLVYYSDYWS